MSKKKAHSQQHWYYVFFLLFLIILVYRVRNRILVNQINPNMRFEIRAMSMIEEILTMLEFEKSYLKNNYKFSEEYKKLINNMSKSFLFIREMYRASEDNREPLKRLVQKMKVARKLTKMEVLKAKHSIKESAKTITRIQEFKQKVQTDMLTVPEELAQSKSIQEIGKAMSETFIVLRINFDQVYETQLELIKQARVVTEDEKNKFEQAQKYIAFEFDKIYKMIAGVGAQFSSTDFERFDKIQKNIFNQITEFVHTDELGKWNYDADNLRKETVVEVQKIQGDMLVVKNIVEDIRSARKALRKELDLLN